MLCSIKSLGQGPFIAVELALHTMALGLMACIGYSDARQVQNKRNFLQSGEDLEAGIDPQKSHPAAFGATTISNKWANNVAGLHNHREIVLMLFALCHIGVFLGWSPKKTFQFSTVYLVQD